MTWECGAMSLEWDEGIIANGITREHAAHFHKWCFLIILLHHLRLQRKEIVMDSLTSVSTIPHQGHIWTPYLDFHQLLFAKTPTELLPVQEVH